MKGPSEMRTTISNAAFLMSLGLGMLAIGGGCAWFVGVTPLDSGGTGGQDGTSMTLGQVYAAAQCDYIVNCCNVEEWPDLDGLDDLIVDYAGCRISKRTFWDGDLGPRLERLVDAGRIEFDEAAFTACMKDIAEWPCSLPQPSMFPLCSGMFIPKVELGGACGAPYECTTGLCQGNCVEKTPAEEPLNLGEDCSTGNSCSAMLYCDGETCVSLKADGQPCTSKWECQSSWCIYDQQGMGTCSTTCDGDGPGAGSVDEDLEAVAVPLMKAECEFLFNCCKAIERVELEYEYATGSFDSEYKCVANHVSSASSWLVQLHNSAALGKVSIDGAKLSACIEKYASMSCQDFSKSMDFSKLFNAFECPDGIQGLVAEGQACTSNVECTTGYCHMSTGMCEALPGAGASCSVDCVAGFYCDILGCTAQKPIGEACSSDIQCTEGRCYGPSGGTETCTLICDGI